MTTDAYRPTDRRPLAARSWGVMGSMASWLARRRVSPNGISVVGMVASVAAGGLLAATAFVDDARFLWLGAGLLIGIRALANILDGMVAIESHRASRLGELFNEVPDRVSDAALLVGLGFAHGGVPLLGFGAALAAVFTAYVRAMGKVAGAPQDYRGPMAKPQRMLVVVAACVLGTIAPGMMGAELGTVMLTPTTTALWLIVAGCVVTSIRRLLRAAAELRDPRR